MDPCSTYSVVITWQSKPPFHNSTVRVINSRVSGQCVRNKTSVPVFYRRIRYKYEFGYVWIKSRVRLIIIICDTQVCYYCVFNAINGRSNLCPDQILLWIVLTNTPNDHTYKQHSFIKLNSILRMIWFRSMNNLCVWSLCNKSELKLPTETIDRCKWISTAQQLARTSHFHCICT